MPPPHLSFRSRSPLNRINWAAMPGGSPPFFFLVVMLTKRQIECLCWVREGKSSTDIGAILGLSPRSVDAYLAAACARLGVRTRTQAVVVATAKGLLPPSIL